MADVEKLERLERQVEFIIDQQAQFSVSIQKLQESQVKADERMTRIENVMVRCYEDTGTKLNALIDSKARLECVVGRAYKDTSAKLSALIDAQTRLDNVVARNYEDTTTKLSALIDAQVRMEHWSLITTKTLPQRWAH
jgi:hypothetical protein